MPLTDPEAKAKPSLAVGKARASRQECDVAGVRRSLSESRHLQVRCLGRRVRPSGRLERRDGGPATSRPGDLVCSCLRRVGVETLVLAAAWGAKSIQLDDRPCDGCAWQHQPAELAGTARRLLALHGWTGSIDLASALPRADSVHRGPGIGRRRLGPLAPKNLEPTAPVPGARPQPPMPRLVLLRALRLLGAPREDVVEAGRAGLWAVQANGDCDLCGVCVPRCPTDALQIVKASGRGTLYLLPVLCNGCNRCVRECPNAALMRVDLIPTQWLTLRAGVAIASADLAPARAAGGWAARSQGALARARAERGDATDRGDALP